MNLNELIQMNLDKFDIPHIFNSKTLSIAKAFKEPTTVDFKGREDLRKKPLCTIDGETSRDFDDGVYCERWHKDGFHLIVSIADVAFYVQENSPIDKEAFLRANSVYFPGNCIPMLPEALSNNLCSLKPNVDRLALSVHMYLDGKGNLKRKRITASVIHSHARLTYEEVQEHLDGKRTNIPQNVQNSLIQLERLYKVRLLQKADRYSFEHEGDDGYFLFENGKPVGISNPKRAASNKLIEECMILANIATAQVLQEKNEFCVNRYHPAPHGTKLERLEDLVFSYGLSPLPEDNVTPKDIWDYVHSVPEGIRKQFKRSLLRTYEKAIYCPDNRGHFGLALDGYSHFTSPIRRYPDLIIHRLLYRCLKLPGWQKYGTKVNLEKLRDQCEHISKIERRTKDTCFTLDDQLTATYYKRLSEEKSNKDAGIYMSKVLAIQKKTGKDGSLKAIGLLVSFDNDNGRANISLSAFNDGFYILGKDGNSLVNSDTKNRIKIGSMLKIKLVTFNIETGHIKAKPLIGLDSAMEQFKQKIGHLFEGKIYKVTENGLLIRLKNENVPAFVPMRLLKDDFYIYSPKNGHTLQGRKFKKIYRCHMEVKVKITGVSEKRQNILCEIV